MSPITSLNCVATIKLPKGLSRIPLLQIPQLIASALYSPKDQASDWEDANRWALNEVLVDAASGLLPMRNPITLGAIEPDYNENVLLADSIAAHTVVTVSDLKTYIARRDFSVEIDDDLPTKSTVNATSDVNYKLLATPTQLLDAFQTRGLRASWFAELQSHAWLLKARKHKGQGQRGHAIPPLFCPYLVMSGLMHNVRRDKRLRPDVAWRILQAKFTVVYNEFESHDPREQSGD